jgi:hypothetical protein
LIDGGVTAILPSSSSFLPLFSPVIFSTVLKVKALITCLEVNFVEWIKYLHPVLILSIYTCDRIPSKSSGGSVRLLANSICAWSLRHCQFLMISVLVFDLHFDLSTCHKLVIWICILICNSCDIVCLYPCVLPLIACNSNIVSNILHSLESKAYQLFVPAYFYITLSLIAFTWN